MSQLRQDNFIKKINRLKIDYPEYAQLLAFLIEKIEQGKRESIRRKLDQMKKSKW